MRSPSPPLDQGHSPIPEQRTTAPEQIAPAPAWCSPEDDTLIAAQRRDLDSANQKCIAMAKSLGNANVARDRALAEISGLQDRVRAAESENSMLRSELEYTADKLLPHEQQAIVDRFKGKLARPLNISPKFPPVDDEEEVLMEMDIAPPASVSTADNRSLRLVAEVECVPTPPFVNEPESSDEPVLLTGNRALAVHREYVKAVVIMADADSDHSHMWKRYMREYTAGIESTSPLSPETEAFVLALVFSPSLSQHAEQFTNRFQNPTVNSRLFYWAMYYGIRYNRTFEEQHPAFLMLKDRRIN